MRKRPTRRRPALNRFCLNSTRLSTPPAKCSPRSSPRRAPRRRRSISNTPICNNCICCNSSCISRLRAASRSRPRRPRRLYNNRRKLRRLVGSMRHRRCHHLHRHHRNRNRRRKHKRRSCRRCISNRCCSSNSSARRRLDLRFKLRTKSKSSSGTQESSPEVPLAPAGVVAARALWRYIRRCMTLSCFAFSCINSTRRWVQSDCAHCRWSARRSRSLRCRSRSSARH